MAGGERDEINKKGVSNTMRHGCLTLKIMSGIEIGDWVVVRCLVLGWVV